MANMDGGTNFGMQPSGAANDKERPEGTSMTDRKQQAGTPRSQQELQMGDKAPLPGEKATQERTDQTSPQKGRH